MIKSLTDVTFQKNCTFWTITSIKDSFKTIIILLTPLDENLKSASFLLLLLIKESSFNNMGVVLNQIYSGWFKRQNFIMNIIVKQRCVNFYHFHDMFQACAFIKMLINNATIFIRPATFDRSLIKGPLYFTNIVSRAARTKKIINNVWFTKQWSSILRVAKELHFCDVIHYFENNRNFSFAVSSYFIDARPDRWLAFVFIIRKTKIYDKLTDIVITIVGSSFPTHE